MTIQYCSDLHLEFISNRDYLEENPLVPTGEILILAGDIMTLSSIGAHGSFFNYISDNFRETYWIPGNHEYYHGDMKGREGSFREKIRSNVTLLNNAVVEVENVQLVFSTLWSFIALNTTWQIERGLNDFYQISNNGKRFDTLTYNELHQEALVFLEDSLGTESNKSRVVVSHHVPTFVNYPVEYLHSPLNQAFASNLDKFIETYKPDYWIYGHHHRNVNTFKIGATTLLTNQLGYVDNKENKSFDPAKTLDL